MSDMFNQEIADILADQDNQAEDQKEKKAKVYHINYRINVRSISCKRLYVQNRGEEIRPYVVFKILGSDKEGVTSVHENTRNPVYQDILLFDGYFVGSDLLKVLVYDCSGETPNLATDRCIGYSHIPVSELELGTIFQHTFKLFKARDGKPMKDKRSREGSAGTVTCEMHLMDTSSHSWKEKPWSATYYSTWVHIVSAEHVPLYKGQPVNPILFSKIKPASNMQRQCTSTCIGTCDPVWNELHCYMADNYQGQVIVFNLCHITPEGEKILLAKTKFQLKLCKPNEITSHNLSMNEKSELKPGEKGCVLRLRVQLLEKNKIPFDGMISFKHSLFNCECQVIEGKEIIAKEGEKPYAIVSIEKNKKQTKPAESNNAPQWGDVLNYRRVVMSSYLLVNVRSAHHNLGQARIHLTRFPIDQDTVDWYNLTDAATGAVRLRIKMTRFVERETDDDDDTHCHFNWEPELGSDYSTDFTGYSQCSRSLTPIVSSNSDKFHFEDYHQVDTPTEKPLREQSITGTLISGSSIFKLPNAKNLYATVSLRGRAKEKHFKVKSAETDNFENPQFNIPFDFPRVKKGDSLFVVIYETLDDGTAVPVCETSKLVKDLPDEFKDKLTLSKPFHYLSTKDIKSYPQAEDYGNVDLDIHSKVTFR